MTRRDYRRRSRRARARAYHWKLAEVVATGRYTYATLWLWRLNEFIRRVYADKVKCLVYPGNALMQLVTSGATDYN